MTKLRNYIEPFIFTVSTLIVIVAMMLLCIEAINKNETIECYKWQSQAREFPSFFLTVAQAQPCEAHGIEIDAMIIQPCESTETPTACQARLGDVWEVIEDTHTGEIRGEYYPD